MDGIYAGHIVISDVVKPHAKEAIEELKRVGIEKTVMLTGDARRVGEHVAAELGLDEVFTELLPGDKVEKVEELLQKKPEKEKLAFVGDGINDAPVLSRADIGIAMGAMGSDAAIEAADVVLMDDDPMKIAKAIKISRKCLGIVYQNIAMALIVKFACLALGAIGIANMYLAILQMWGYDPRSAQCDPLSVCKKSVAARLYLIMVSLYVTMKKKGKYRGQTDVTTNQIFSGGGPQ